MDNGQMRDLANIPDPKIEYVGGIVIHATDPPSLAAWYTKTFEFETSMQHEGGYYGGFRAPWGELHFGIVPGKENVDYDSNISIIFRVSDFEGYLKKLKQNGLTPGELTDDGEGRFASFVDPEGNRISIWGS